jgi:nucleoside-diphosphate-sugar epimerase
MRKVLILGGNRWLGARVAARCVAAGDEVTCLARTETPLVPAGARLVQADRRRPGAYDSVLNDWAEVVELAWPTDVVGSALQALGDRAAHWTLVSTVSVYARNDEPNADEAAAVVEPVDLDDYGQAKVAGERAAAERVGDRLLIVRPGLIAGPGDPSDRFGYWPARLRRGGDVLVPGADGLRVQVIDVDDLADFIVAAARSGARGVVNAVGDSLPFAEVLARTAKVAGFAERLVPAPEVWLLEHEVRYWMGERSLPLWLPDGEVGFATRSNAAYRAAGGVVRPIGDTIARVLADEVERGLDRTRRSGLGASEERALVAELKASGG